MMPCCLWGAAARPPAPPAGAGVRQRAQGSKPPVEGGDGARSAAAGAPTTHLQRARASSRAVWKERAALRVRGRPALLLVAASRLEALERQNALGDGGFRAPWPGHAEMQRVRKPCSIAHASSGLHCSLFQLRSFGARWSLPAHHEHWQRRRCGLAGTGSPGNTAAAASHITAAGRLTEKGAAAAAPSRKCAPAAAPALCSVCIAIDGTGSHMHARLLAPRDLPPPPPPPPLPSQPCAAPPRRTFRPALCSAATDGG